MLKYCWLPGKWVLCRAVLVPCWGSLPDPVCEKRSWVLGETKLPRNGVEPCWWKGNLSRDIPQASVVLACFKWTMFGSRVWAGAVYCLLCPINFQQSHTVIVTKSIWATSYQHLKLNLWPLRYHWNQSCGASRWKTFYYLLFHLLLFALLINLSSELLQRNFIVLYIVRFLTVIEKWEHLSFAYRWHTEQPRVAQLFLQNWKAGL